MHQCSYFSYEGHTTTGIDGTGKAKNSSVRSTIHGQFYQNEEQLLIETTIGKILSGATWSTPSKLSYIQDNA